MSSFKHLATLTSSSHMKLKMMLGIDTRFLQSLKFNEARFIKCLIEEGSSVKKQAMLDMSAKKQAMLDNAQSH